MAFNADQPRDENGRWTSIGNAAPKAAVGRERAAQLASTLTGAERTKLASIQRRTEQKVIDKRGGKSAEKKRAARENRIIAAARAKLKAKYEAKKQQQAEAEAEAEAESKSKSKKQQPVAAAEVAPSEWTQTSKFSYALPNGEAVLVRNSSSVVFSENGEARDATKPIWELHQGNQVMQLHTEGEKFTAEQALKKASELVVVDRAQRAQRAERAVRAVDRAQRASKAELSPEHIREYAAAAAPAAASALANRRDSGRLMHATQTLIGHAYPNLVKDERPDTTTFISDSEVMPGARAHKEGAGRTVLNTQTAKSAAEGLARLRASQALEPDHVDALSTLAHEEIHGYGAYNSTGFSRVVEEVSTETLARKMARALPQRELTDSEVERHNQLHALPLQSEQSPGGAYGQEIQTALRHLSDATGITEDQRLHEILEKGAEKFKSHEDAYASQTKMFADSMSITPEQKNKFYALIEAYSQSDRRTRLQ